MNTHIATTTRRGFVAGAAAAGAALCAVPTAHAGASEEQPPGAGAGWSWLQKPEPIADDQIAKSYDCDVLVIGAGTAGNPAALYASMNGHKTIVMQKEAFACLNGSFCGMWNSQYGTGQGIEWDMLAVLQKFAQCSDGNANLGLAKRLLEQSGSVVEWLVDEVPEPAYQTMIVENHVLFFWPSTYSGDPEMGMREFHDNIVAKAEENGATYLYETPAVQLVVDESGRVTGAIGQNENGYVKVNASLGVILCTGDISDSDEMLEAYCPLAVGVSSAHAVRSNTGDGTKMGLWAGGRLEHTPANLQIHLDPSPLPGGTAPFISVPWLHVNNRGERFTNENVEMTTLALQVREQPSQHAFQIIDSHLLEHASEYPNGYHVSADEAAVETAVERGCGFKADTIEELAELIGVPADSLVATVERYNGYVDAGCDEEFGVDPQILAWNGIKDAPFYAFQYQPALVVAGAGLRCNDRLQVLNGDGEPIEGLYAAGDVQGSLFGFLYPVSDFGGFTVGRAVVGGVLAVKSAEGTLE